MADCPCCREVLPSSAEPNELCPKCARALETGVDEPKQFFTHMVPSSGRWAFQSCVSVAMFVLDCSS
jgi:hypothetical protein